MTRYIEKSKAIKLRKKGYSYSQIKKILGVSKSTLSNWLNNYPLSKKRISELRDNNPKRIERYISTMRKKREHGLSLSYEKVKKDIGSISDRDLFIAGFFLYWAEGGKTRRNTLVLTNTDPNMIKNYLSWLKLLKVSKDKLKVKLNLYKDMNVDREISFWSRELGIDREKFYKVSVKNSKMVDLTYKNNFNHGTCNIILHDTNITSYVLMGIKFIGNVVSVR